MENYPLVFDPEIAKQLEKVARDMQIKTILTKMFDRIEENGSNAGKLIDPTLFLYKLKNKHPPLRLYFKHKLDTNEIYLFSFEMKTSEQKQRESIERIRFKSRHLF